MSFRTLGFFDASRFTAQMLLAHSGEFEDSPDPAHHAIASLWLRKHGTDTEREVAWIGARNILVRFANEAALAFNGVPPDLDSLEVRRTDPGASTDWSIPSFEEDYASRLFRVQLELVPSPGFMLFTGVAQVPMMVGAATWVDWRVIGSEINVGPVPNYRVIADFLSPDSETRVLN